MTRKWVALAATVVACGGESAGPSAGAVRLEVTPKNPIVMLTGTLQLNAHLRDAQGNPVAGEPPAWTVSEPSVATIGTSGVLTGLTTGFTYAIASTSRFRDSSRITVQPAAVLVDTRVGTIGAGDTLQLAARLVLGATTVPSSIRWRSVDTAIATISASGLLRGKASGTTEVIAEQPPQLPRTISVRVASYNRWKAIAVGGTAACAINDEDVGYCWGSQWIGELGSRTGATEVPTRIAGDHRWKAISMARIYNTRHQSACGLTVTNEGYCWGADLAAPPVPNGSGASRSDSVPRKVELADLRQIATDWLTSCALNAAGEAWCWGTNVFGTMGIGNTQPGQYATPQKVPVAHVFTGLSLGQPTACGLTGSGEVWCWGANPSAGTSCFDGFSTVKCDPSPSLRQSGVAQLFDGAACGITSARAGICWGGSTGPHGTGPWKMLSVGPQVGCGIDQADDGYCWGVADMIGANINDATTCGGGNTGRCSGPMKVYGGFRFRHIAAGYRMACGITLEGMAYCWGREFINDPFPGSGPAGPRNLRPVAVPDPVSLLP